MYVFAAYSLKNNFLLLQSHANYLWFKISWNILVVYINIYVFLILINKLLSIALWTDAPYILGTGVAMLNVFQEGDLILSHGYFMISRLRIGDIVLFRGANDNIVAHRIIDFFVLNHNFFSNAWYYVVRLRAKLSSSVLARRPLPDWGDSSWSVAKTCSHPAVSTRLCFTTGGDPVGRTRHWASANNTTTFPDFEKESLGLPHTTTIKRQSLLPRLNVQWARTTNIGKQQSRLASVHHFLDRSHPSICDWYRQGRRKLVFDLEEISLRSYLLFDPPAVVDCFKLTNFWRCCLTMEKLCFLLFWFIGWFFKHASNIYTIFDH